MDQNLATFFDQRLLAMDFFELLLVTLAFLAALPEYRRQKKEDYGYLLGGMAIVMIYSTFRLLISSTDYVFVLQVIPAMDLLGSFIEALSFLLITAFFAVSFTRSSTTSFAWSRLLMLAVIGITGLFIILQGFGLISGMEGWTIVGQPTFRMVLLVVIISGIAQFLTSKIKPVLAIIGFILFAIAHLYHLFYYPDHNPSFISAIYPWPYIFNPLGYFFIVSAVFQRITQDQMNLTLQLRKRSQELENATSNLTRLNRLSTNLLRTTELKGIIRMILDSLQLDLGYRNSALFILEKGTATLRGYKISQLTGGPVSFPQIDIQKKSFIAECFLQAKSLYFGEGHTQAKGDFLRDYDFSTNITIIPLMTKKEVECFEINKCKDKNCPVQSWDLNICWMINNAECPCGYLEQGDKLKRCIECPSFNLVGMMVLDNRSAKVKADENNIAFLETFANQAGMALQNAYLVDDLSKESSLRTETLKNLPVGVIVLDPSGFIREYNDAMTQITRISDDAALGKSYSDIKLVDDTKSLYTLIQSILDGMTSGLDTDLMTHTFTLGNSVKILNVKLRPIHKNLKLNGLILMVEDITSMKELEHQLVRSESLASMGQLAMGIAHEINNPLAGVSGVLQVLEKRFEDGSSERKALVTALKDLKRASGIIKDLLNFAKPSVPKKKLFDLNTLIEEALDFIPYQHGGESVTIIRDLDEKMPLITADPDQIQQVLTNLILNSLSATTKGGPEGRIEVTTWFDKNWVFIQFEDNGSGIPTDNLKKIFDPFFSTKGAGKGTGLGLSLCDRIINDHGGIITVRSVPGLSTAFLIKLPRKGS